ncbi:MAG: hypothetical protein EBS39_13525, partial [Gammaproteobacteria bacterium]|nr:hypothetical protein [Gammaproteobacteria bacterium]
YAWGLKGNTGSTSSGVLGGAPAPGSNFIGTLDNTDIRFVANNKVRGILRSDNGRLEVDSLRAGEVSSSGNLVLRAASTIEGLRVASNGLVGVGGVAIPDAQLQIRTVLGTTPGLLLNGADDQTANLLDAQVGGVSRFVVSATGALSAGSLQVADVGAGSPNNLTPAGYDRVVIANGSGQFSQIAFSQLSNENTWLLAGNAGVNSTGNIGSPAGGSFLGTTDTRSLRLATNGTVRAILDGTTGTFSIGSVAVSGGSLNGVTIGASSPGAGSFTSLNASTVAASSSVTTPSVSSTSGLSLATTGAGAGGISLSAGGINAITFATNGAERLRITDEGKVGIGTSAPGAMLQVTNTV